MGFSHRFWGTMSGWELMFPAKQSMGTHVSPMEPGDKWSTWNSSSPMGFWGPNSGAVTAGMVFDWQRPLSFGLRFCALLLFFLDLMFERNKNV